MIIQEVNNQLIIPLYIQPRACQDKIIGLYAAKAIKITITAPPVEGKANQHLLRYLAKIFNLHRNQLHIDKGEQSRYKKLIITPPYCKQHLANLLQLHPITGTLHVK